MEINSNMYVCTDVDPRNPTYFSGDDAWLYISDDPLDADPRGTVTRAPLIPRDEAEVREFARMFGWSVKVKSGRIMILTDIPVEKK